MKLPSIKNSDSNYVYPLFFTIIFIFILVQYSFNTLDAIFYDLWIRGDISKQSTEKIVIIEIDEESDNFLGEIYPYSYATHLRFISRLVRDEPLQINYLSTFALPQDQIDLKNMELFHKKVTKFKDQGGFFQFGVEADAWGVKLPPKALQSLGNSLAILNKDGSTFAKDDVTRRLILNISGEDSFHLKVANKLRLSSGLLRLEATSYQGEYYDTESDALFSLFKYSSSPLKTENFKTISFHKVLVGNFPRDFFKDKVVLIGSKYLSNTADFIMTPFGKEDSKAAKLYVHSELIQALVNDKTIISMPNSVSQLIAIIIAIMLSLFISKVQPTKGLVLTISLILGVFLISFLSFTLFGVWLKLAHIVLSIFVVYYIWVPFRAIAEYQTRYTFEEETKVLKKVDKLKHNFISLMSHDLKTPVAKIAGISDILQEQYSNSPRQQELLGDIRGSTEELNNFITSILDLAKIESRDIALKIESKDINTIVEAVVSSVKKDLDLKEMVIEVNLEPLYPVKVDQQLIKRVFANIIGNSIKYAGKGSKISLNTYDDSDWVYIEIQDDGVGIPPDELEHIFDKFYRVKNDSSHKIKGSGLGLYLVKYFIELHHGSINVESQLGKGTKFIIKLKNE